MAVSLDLGESLTPVWLHLGRGQSRSQEVTRVGHDPSKKGGSPVPQLPPTTPTRKKRLWEGVCSGGGVGVGQLGIMWEGRGDEEDPCSSKTVHLGGPGHPRTSHHTRETLEPWERQGPNPTLSI